MITRKIMKKKKMFVLFIKNNIFVTQMLDLISCTIKSIIQVETDSETKTRFLKLK